MQKDLAGISATLSSVVGLFVEFWKKLIVILDDAVFLENKGTRIAIPALIQRMRYA